MHRSNVASESINAFNARTNAVNAATKQLEADTQRKTAIANVQYNNRVISLNEKKADRDYAQTIRANQLKEAAQSEVKRSNKANEALKEQQTDAGIVGNIIRSAGRIITIR